VSHPNRQVRPERGDDEISDRDDLSDQADLSDGFNEEELARIEELRKEAFSKSIMAKDVSRITQFLKKLDSKQVSKTSEQKCSHIMDQVGLDVIESHGS
jgi:hypothetical protein